MRAVLEKSEASSREIEVYTGISRSTTKLILKKNNNGTHFNFEIDKALEKVMI